MNFLCFWLLRTYYHLLHIISRDACSFQNISDERPAVAAKSSRFLSLHSKGITTVRVQGTSMH